MKVRNLLLMTLILSLLAGATYYLASRRNKPEPCEVVTESQIYLAIGETYPFDAEKFEISDETVLAVEEGRIAALSKGEARISAGCHDYVVSVSDLYTVPVLNMDKDYLPEGRYTS